jgi:AraC-like DNA-binding protein
MFHFVLQGSGVLRGPKGETHQLEHLYLGLVPKDMPHALECGGEVQSVRTIDTPPTDPGVVRLVAGASNSAYLEVACGVVRVNYGDSLGLFQRLREITVADLTVFPQARVAFESILAEQGGARPGSGALTQALMSQCLVYLLRYLSEQSESPLPWLSALEDPSLGRAVDLIFEHPASTHTVDSLADAAIMSRSVFAQRFHRAFGCPPITFLHDVRLRRAAVLLRQSTALSIQQVADRVGFGSRSHFSQTFKAHFGVTPAAFRKGPEPT